MLKVVCKFLFLLYFFPTVSFAVSTPDAGVNEIDVNLAKSVLKNILVPLTYAENVVVNNIYPYLSSYSYDVTQASTRVYAYLINTSGNTSTFSNWLTTRTDTNSSTYTKNPYISKLAIVDYGLKIQMQFVSNYVTPVTGYKTSRLLIPDAFLGKRIVLVPDLNLVYYTIKKGKKKQYIVIGYGISDWSCYTDVDETIASSANGIDEGMVSIVSIAGGVLDGCEYITKTTMNSLWITI